jgi:prepilin-type N-terminal cleavage/methylation domain-containing protein
MQKAFTLIELLVFIAIIVIMFAIISRSTLGCGPTKTVTVSVTKTEGSVGGQYYNTPKVYTPEGYFTCSDDMLGRIHEGQTYTFLIRGRQIIEIQNNPR